MKQEVFRSTLTYRKLILLIIDASANYRGNYWAEYDARPDWYGNENSGNCNSIQSMLEQIAGGTTPNIPDKAYGWNHLMSMSFFQ